MHSIPNKSKIQISKSKTYCYIVMIFDRLNLLKFKYSNFGFLFLMQALDRILISSRFRMFTYII